MVWAWEPRFHACYISYETSEHFSNILNSFSITKRVRPFIHVTTFRRTSCSWAYQASLKYTIEIASMGGLRTPYYREGQLDFSGRCCSTQREAVSSVTK
jgi:hypothetical protein